MMYDFLCLFTSETEKEKSDTLKTRLNGTVFYRWLKFINVLRTTHILWTSSRFAVLKQANKTQTCTDWFMHVWFYDGVHNTHSINVEESTTHNTVSSCTNVRIRLFGRAYARLFFIFKFFFFSRSDGMAQRQQSAIEQTYGEEIRVMACVCNANQLSSSPCVNERDTELSSLQDSRTHTPKQPTNLVVVHC